MTKKNGKTERLDSFFTQAGRPDNVSLIKNTLASLFSEDQEVLNIHYAAMDKNKTITLGTIALNRDEDTSSIAQATITPDHPLHPEMKETYIHPAELFLKTASDLVIIEGSNILIAEDKAKKNGNKQK